MFRLLQFWGTYRRFAMQKTVTRRLKQTFYYPRGFVRPANPGEEPAQQRKIEYDRSLLEYLDE